MAQVLFELFRCISLTSSNAHCLRHDVRLNIFVVLTGNVTVNVDIDYDLATKPTLSTSICPSNEMERILRNPLVPTMAHPPYNRFFRGKLTLAFDVSSELTSSVRVLLNHLPAAGHEVAE